MISSVITAQHSGTELERVRESAHVAGFVPHGNSARDEYGNRTLSDAAKHSDPVWAHLRSQRHPALEADKLPESIEIAIVSD